VLTADTAGDIAAWDIITCRCLGIFSRQELSSLQPPQSDRASTAARGREVKELLEMVRIMVEGEGITQAWASVDVRVGSLTVHLDEGRCFGAEIYCDDADLNTTAQVEIARINPGKVMLRNIFDKFVSSSVSQNALNTTVETPRGQRQSPPSHIVIPKATVPMPLDLNLLSASRKGATTAGIALATPATTSVLPPSSTDLSKRATDASLANVRADLPSSRPGTPNTDTGDYFANVSSDAPASPTLTKNTPNRFMGKLKGLGRSNMKKGSSTDAVDGQAGSAAQKEVAKDGSTELDAQLRTVRGLMARPLQVPSLSEVPVLADFPTNLVYSVSEQAKSSDVWTVIYRGLAGTTDGDEAQVMAVAPLWILEYLLAGRVPAVEPLKITFLLQPWSQGGDDDLPEMPERSATVLCVARN
jgi:WD repeat-containing protein 48